MDLIMVVLIGLVVLLGPVWSVVAYWQEKASDGRTMREELLRHWAANNTVWSDLSINHFSYYLFLLVGGTRHFGVLREQKDSLADRHYEIMLELNDRGILNAHRAIAYCGCRVAEDFRATKLALKRLLQLGWDG